MRTREYQYTTGSGNLNFFEGVCEDCEGGESNPHEIAPASPSSWCVYQFRHLREETAIGFTWIANMCQENRWGDKGKLSHGRLDKCLDSRLNEP